MFPRTVSTTRRVHVRDRTLRDRCVHTFLTYEVMSMHNFKHITPCLSHNFNRCTRNKVPHHDFLTYEPFSLCNFWLSKTSPCANCHMRERVCLQRVTKFLTFYLDHHVSTHCVDYETCSCACLRTKKTCLHTFRIRKTYMRSFNTWHPVSYIISHRCTWNEIQTHDF